VDFAVLQKAGGDVVETSTRPDKRKTLRSAFMQNDLAFIAMLRKILRYEPATGKIYWRPLDLNTFRTDKIGQEWNAKNAGQEAFLSSDRYGFRSQFIHGRPKRAHEVAWGMHYGSWTTERITHINGDNSDNRIENLALKANKGKQHD
jgi:hypothetical protein